MDPIKDVLDEAFFLQASPECLLAFSKLIDDGVATLLQRYLETVDVDHPVAQVINNYLGEAMRTATFHLVIKERKLHDLVAKLNLESVADMQVGRAEMRKQLEYLQDNFPYIRARIEPPTKEDFVHFQKTAPNGYDRIIAANSLMFYQPRATARMTGVGNILRRWSECEIALKGLQYRDYCDTKGFVHGSFLVKEF